MSSRFKMNRMGFVNFWLYDEEIFTFEDGKLLLRGQNGSGKSITTQSFIPFILDGDRTPSRLDPFGSSDRKMEYYFLGEGQQEESTGYLFLEFKKGDSGQYRTIGIGQRARRGAPMTFWGFVLTDGRRIGYDLNLYKEVGSKKLPYSKQDLKKVLGPEVPFTDSPGEYKAMVNKYIFGFRRMEQYEQFIRLLVKVRAPKLSKEFKPTKVYDILNESLQTLTDEELRAMVDAMEKMDAIQSNLDHLKAAQKDAQNIQKEYTRYNQFMLGRKAKAYLESSKKAETLKLALEEDETRLEQLRQEEIEKRRLREEGEQRKNLLEVELDSLKETDLDQVTRRLLDNRNRKEKLESERKKWQDEAEKARENLVGTDRRIREYEGGVEDLRGQVEENRKEMESLQAVMEFKLHGQAVEKMAEEAVEGIDDISREIREWSRKITEGIKTFKEQEEVERRYDQAAAEAAGCLAATVKREAELEKLEEGKEQARDLWIQEWYELPKRNQEFIPDQKFLKELETQILAYEGAKDRSGIRRKWEQWASDRQSLLLKLKVQKDQERENLLSEEREKQEELKSLREQKDWEPERATGRIRSRQMLTEAGISWIPFYQAMEFAPHLTEMEKNTLEEQFTEAGFLDALIVGRRHWDRVRQEFPEYADMMVCAPESENGTFFEKLVPAPGLPADLRIETEYILRAMRDETGDFPDKAQKLSEMSGIAFQGNGFFRNGILEGRSLGRGQASFIGYLTRKHRLKQQIDLLLQEFEVLKQKEEAVERELEIVDNRQKILEQELAQAPDGEALDEILDKEKECRWYLEQEQERLKEARRKEESLKAEKEKCLQQVIRLGRELPYGRTLRAYEEAQETSGEYLELWLSTCSFLRDLSHKKALLINEKEKAVQYEDSQDMALYEISGKKKELEIIGMAIRKAEEFLNRPENRQLARRLETLRTEREKLEQNLKEWDKRLAVLQDQKESGAKRLEESKADLTWEIARETGFRGYFEEELDLKLVLERGTKSLKECANEAWASLRENDRNREPGALVGALHENYHKYSGSLLGYGIAMEDCFEEGAADGQSLRKRQRIYSVWNGKKLYFAQFVQTLKSTIEETELLIQEKDREIFVDILSRTLSQQLTDRIEESRQWIRSMSALMKEMDTSMGLSFSLEWKPRSGEGEQEIDTLELEKLLRRDQALLTSEDVERVARHFRSKVQTEKAKLEENGMTVNYIDMVRDALDYRKWFEFRMFYYRNQGEKKPLTNGAFNKFSGGEKAMAMYVPLFAAVNAQYQKSSKQDFPRMMALDEAFAGVDDKNISSMFKLVDTLDFDYIMNSQAIWGCYETVPALRISELYRPADARTVTVIHYTWNGHERILDEQ